MKLGNKKNFVLLLFFLQFHLFLHADNKIFTTPLINLNEIKPSFEETDIKTDKTTYSKIKNKNKNSKSNVSSQAIIIGLDKITAKSSKIYIKLNEVKKFGPLEIKILRCGKVKNDNKTDDVAYMQVKDLSKNNEDKVFIFNGWTFASDPSLTPFDHAIYDLQLSSCNA